MGANTYVAVGIRTVGSGTSGGGATTTYFASTPPAGTLESFTLLGSVGTGVFSWSPQDNLTEFGIEIAGAGGGGGGMAGKSARRETPDAKGIVITYDTQATCASGGSGGGAPYSKRLYNMAPLRSSSAVLSITAAAAGGTGGAFAANGFNTPTTVTATAGADGSGNSSASITIAGTATEFLTLTPGSGGTAATATLVTQFVDTCGTSLQATQGIGGAAGSITTVDLASSGLSLIGSAIDENGVAGTDGTNGCAADIGGITDVTANPGLQTGGTGGQCGGTEAQAQTNTLAGAEAVASNGNTTSDTAGNNYGGGGAGGSAEVQGTNTGADPGGANITALAGGTGAGGACRLTFVWSGTAADQPTDSDGNVIAPD